MDTGSITNRRKNGIAPCFNADKLPNAEEAPPTLIHLLRSTDIWLIEAVMCCDLNLE